MSATTHFTEVCHNDQLELEQIVIQGQQQTFNGNTPIPTGSDGNNYIINSKWADCVII